MCCEGGVWVVAAGVAGGGLRVPEGANDVDGVHEGMADCGELPVENGDYTGFCGVEDLEVVSESCWGR